MSPKLAQISLTASLFIILFGSLFIFNVKSLLLLLILSGCLLFFILQKSFFETATLLFFIFLPFENSFRQWPIYLSGVESLTTYTQFFGITPKIVIGFLLMLLLWTYPSPPIHKTTSLPTKLLLLFIAISAISTLFITGRSVFLLTGLIGLIIPLLYYLVSHYFFQNHRQIIFIIIITLFSLFSSYIGIRQLIKQQQLGLFIELTPRFSPDGYTTTDGDRQFRVSGFISHPVYFGSFLCLLLPIVLGIVFKKRQSPFSIVFYSLVALALTITILGTNSRSTWINLVMIYIGFFAFLYRQKYKINNTIIKWIGVGLLILAILIFPTLSTRAESIQELLSNRQGSLYSRIKLIQHSITAVTIHPLTGVGLNNFPFFLSSNGITENFSAPPHSTILIFLAELGIPATLVFIYYLWTLLFPATNPLKWNMFKFSLWISLLTFIISSQFHPLFNLDPTFCLFLTIAGVFASLCQPSKI